MAENWLIAGLSFSIMINVIIIGFFTVTGMGKQVFGRFKRRLMFPRGKYVNILFLNKSGILKEYFLKPERDGSFKINQKRYVRDARTSVNYERIPTQFHLEDNALPINLYEADYDGMSSGELDTVIMANTQFDILEFLRKYGFLILIAILVLMGLLAANTFFGNSVFEAVRDGTITTAAPVIPGG